MKKKEKIALKIQAKESTSFVHRHYKICIFFILALGFIFRLMPWSQVMTDNVVQLKGSDAYYFVREAENIQNGGLPNYDPMFCYDRGWKVDKDNLLYSQILATAGKIMPIEVATAWSAPVFGILSAFAIFLVLSELFPDNKYAVLAGTAIASLTGLQFIARSYFGFGDRHVLETFLSFMGIWASIRALKRQSFKWALGAGLIFILYLWAWDAAPIVMLCFGLGMVLEMFINNKTDRTWIYISLIYLPPVIAGLLLKNMTMGMGGAGIIAGSAFLTLIMKKISNRKNQLYIIGGTVTAGIVAFAFVAPSAFQEALKTLKLLVVSDEVSAGISEYQPMFSLYNIENLGGLQLLIHAITAFGLFFMIKRKHWGLVFFGTIILIMSLAKIRSEYYLLIINGIAFASIVADYKMFSIFAIIISILFSSIYWKLENDRGKIGLVFNNNDYNMAEWMKINLPTAGILDSGAYLNEPRPNYWIAALWDNGYLYSYIAKRPMLASPNLCNYLTPTSLLKQTDEEQAYAMAKSYNIKYILVKLGNMSGYYIPSNDGRYFFTSTYYKALNQRLFNFNGQTLTSKNPYYLSGGKLIQTDNYDLAYMNSTNHEVYGDSGFISPINMPALKHFKLIHSEGIDENSVKLFEVVD